MKSKIRGITGSIRIFRSRIYGGFCMSLFFMRLKAKLLGLKKMAKLPVGESYKENVEENVSALPEHNVTVDFVDSFVEKYKKGISEVLLAEDYQEASCSSILGCILGDILGEPYEYTRYSPFGNGFEPELYQERNHFTDDTVLTLMTLSAEKRYPEEYRKAYIHGYKNWPDSDFGGGFIGWASGKIDNTKGYDSFGNGSAMRVSPVLLSVLNDDSCQGLESVLKSAFFSSVVTHNHTAGIEGAMVIAACAYYLANNRKEDLGKVKEVVLSYARQFYDMDFEHYNLKSLYCHHAVPFAIQSFVRTNSYDECMKYILCRLPCDADTVCAIAGTLAGAYYGIMEDQKQYILSKFQDTEFAELKHLINTIT